MKQAKFYTVTKNPDLIPVILLEEEFLRSREGMSVNTLRAYTSDLRCFREYVGKVQKLASHKIFFCEVTKGMIENFVKERAMIDAVATVNRRLACLKSFCGYVSDKFKSYDPAEKVRNVKDSGLKFKSLSQDEQVRVLEQLEHEPVRDWFMVLLLFHTGLRVQELSDMKFWHLSRDRRWFNEVRGKGGRVRAVPIPLELRRAFLRYMDWRTTKPTGPQYPLIISTTGATRRKPDSYKISVKSIYRVCSRVMTAAGVREELCHPHTLRHTYAKNVLRHIGEKIRNPSEALVVLRDLLGHSSIQTTMIYLENSKDDISELMEDIA
jgi:site-specific recombinase XerD